MLDFIVKSVTANGVVTFESFMISSADRTRYFG